MERESGCGRCGKRKWVWLGGRCREGSGCVKRRMGDVWRGEVGMVEKRMEVCGGEVGVGEENGRCVEGNWVWCGGEWEVWSRKVGVVVW